MGNGRKASISNSRNVYKEKIREREEEREVSKTAASSWGKNLITDDNAYVSLRNRMGQTGLEAGDPNEFDSRRKLYVKTSKAFNINRYLETDGNDIHSRMSNWDNLGYTKRMVKNDIAKIDSGMRELPEDVDVSRYIHSDVFAKMVGNNAFSKLSFDSTISQIESDASQSKAFSNALQQLDYTHKPYTSTSWNSNNVFTTYDVKLEMTFQKGVKAILTSNDVESEVLGAHGLKYDFTGEHRVDVIKERSGLKRKQLVVRVIVHK